MGILALIGLGSNLGDRKTQLDTAMARLSGADDLDVRAISRYRETDAVGGPAGQGPFLNAAAAVETSLEPAALLDVLQEIEGQAGRQRTVRWGERTLDLDLLLFGDRLIDEPGLRVPHPRMALRRFVLAPLAEIAADAVDPLTGRTVAGLLANLDRRPGYIAIVDHHPAGDSPLFGRLVDALSAEPIRLAELGIGPFAEEYGLATLSALLGRRRAIEPLAALMVVDRWAGPEWDDRWLVSDFWFDQLFLSIDTLRASRPRFPAFRERFVRVRSEVIPPTFVVALPEPAHRLGLHDSKLAWQRPIGWDTPILRPESDDLDAIVAEVLATCTATRPF